VHDWSNDAGLMSTHDVEVPDPPPEDVPEKPLDDPVVPPLEEDPVDPLLDDPLDDPPDPPEDPLDDPVPVITSTVLPPHAANIEPRSPNARRAWWMDDAIG
jgi:hypothetical protein